MLKDIWNTVTGNYRYIKYDGSEFHRKKGWAYLDTPEIKVGIACTAFNIASVAYNVGDLGSLISGNWYSVSNLTRDTISKQASDLLSTALLCTAVINRRALNKFPLKDKAIDTTGKSLSRAELSLSDYNNLKYTRTKNAIVTGIFGAFVAPGMINSAIDTGTISTLALMMLTTHYMAFERAQNILNGKYVICDEPPKKREKIRQQAPVLGSLGAR